MEDLFCLVAEESEEILSSCAEVSSLPEKQRIEIHFPEGTLLATITLVRNEEDIIQVVIDPIVAFRQKAKKQLTYIKQKHRQQFDIPRIIRRIKLIIDTEIRISRSKARAEEERKVTKALTSRIMQGMDASVRQKINIFNAGYGYGITYFGLKNPKSIYSIIGTMLQYDIIPDAHFAALESKAEMLFEYYRTKELLFGIKIHRDLNPIALESITKIIANDFKEDFVS